jgi:hypothetical protein
MLRNARMAAMRKLHRSVETVSERLVWAVHVGRGEIVWQDRSDAANGSKEPGADTQIGIPALLVFHINRTSTFSNFIRYCLCF